MFNDDTLDSRDIQAQIDELEPLVEDEPDEDDLYAWDLKEELEALQAFKDEVNSSQWDEGILFINEYFFEDYARELAEDIGAIDRNAMWPANCINWAQAADALLIDYTSVELDGITYYYR